jgi:hypothetical protein
LIAFLFRHGSCSPMNYCERPWLCSKETVPPLEQAKEVRRLAVPARSISRRLRITRCRARDAVIHAYADTAQEEKDSVKTKDFRLGKPSCWQFIFLQSRVNGAPYNGEALPGQSWDWPKDTYFQRRLHLIKILQPAEGLKVN